MNTIFEIESFEQKCSIINILLQSERLLKHTDPIGVYPSLSNSALYEHKCLENIKMLYKSSVKYDDHQQYKDILEAENFSAPE